MSHRVNGYEMKLIAVTPDGQEIDVPEALDVGRVLSHGEVRIYEDQFLAVAMHKARAELVGETKP